MVKSILFLIFINFQVTFTTDSDCEVLLHLYKEYGPHFLKKVALLRRLLLSMVLTNHHPHLTHQHPNLYKLAFDAFPPN